MTTEKVQRTNDLLRQFHAISDALPMRRASTPMVSGGDAAEGVTAAILVLAGAVEDLRSELVAQRVATAGASAGR
jgi:hypothetical protein